MFIIIKFAVKYIFLIHKAILYVLLSKLKYYNTEKIKNIIIVDLAKEKLHVHRNFE